jgi:hypothetical protein
MPMGNHKLEHRQTRVNITSSIVSEVIVVETRRQPTRVDITQSLNVGITTTRVETFVAPTMAIIKRGYSLDQQQNWVVDRVES